MEVHEGPVVGSTGVPAVDLDGTIGADDLPVGTPGEDAAFECAADRAADDRNHATVSHARPAVVLDLAELGLDLECRLEGGHRRALLSHSLSSLTRPPGRLPRPPAFCRTGGVSEGRLLRISGTNPAVRL